MTNQSQVNLRNIVLNMLLELKEQKSHIILKNTLDKYNYLEKNQRSFITKLFQGTVERTIELDYIINQFSKTPTKKMKPVIRNIIRMCTYQIKYMDNVPDTAACNEAVKLAAKRKFNNLKGFVNGVTRNIARNIDNVEYPKKHTDYLSVKYSVPKWIVEFFIEQYSEEITESILDSLYEEKALTVRCNTSKASVEDIIKSLEFDGAKVEKSNLYEKALYLKDFNNLRSLSCFNSGMITVQDLSSIMVGLAANPKENDLIIDVCAAPGGKSLHVSELTNNKANIIARDLTEYKINLIKDNIKRIGLKNIKTEVWDATVLDEKNIGKADIVIADLPCSGLGVIGNKSDIKYNVTREQIDQLVDLQREILKIVSKYLKVGGKLIFSTCTVNKLENDGNVSWIEDNLNMKLCSLEDVLPEPFNRKEGYVQIIPGQYGMDGFFVSSFIKQ